MRKSNSYIGGHTIIRDPAFTGRLARNLRKTKQAEQRRTRDRKRFEAELKAFAALRPQSILIKREEK